MCEKLAQAGSNAYNLLDVSTRRQILQKMLDLDKRQMPNTEGIIYWNADKNRVEKMYRWELLLDIDKYLSTYSDGIYICHGTPDDTILRTQTKYNNGIIEGMSSKKKPEEWRPYKSNNYISSWNCVAPNLEKIFRMSEVDLIE